MVERDRAGPPEMRDSVNVIFKLQGKKPVRVVLEAHRFQNESHRFALEEEIDTILREPSENE